MQYEKEKEYLDSLIKDFVDLIKKLEELKSQSDIKKDVTSEKERFENDFVALNCEIQQIRSDNETLLDEIKNKEDHIKYLDKEIQEIKDLIDRSSGEMLRMDNPTTTMEELFLEIVRDCDQRPGRRGSGA